MPIKKKILKNTQNNKKKIMILYVFFAWQRTHLHLCWFVVPPVVVLVGRAVSVTQETLEAIFAAQLANDLVQCLTVEGVVVHCKGGIADGGKQGCVCVLPRWERRVSVRSDARVTLRTHLETLKDSYYENTDFSISFPRLSVLLARQQPHQVWKMTTWAFLLWAAFLQCYCAETSHSDFGQIST